MLYWLLWPYPSSSPVGCVTRRGGSGTSKSSSRMQKICPRAGRAPRRNPNITAPAIQQRGWNLLLWWEWQGCLVSVENEEADYFKSGATAMYTLNQFPTIKRVSLKYYAATPSSAPVERLFSFGNLILSPKRNRLSDQKLEKLLLLRYNHWFAS